jgi:hypothetical protein
MRWPVPPGEHPPIRDAYSRGPGAALVTSAANSVWAMILHPCSYFRLPASCGASADGLRDSLGPCDRGGSAQRQRIHVSKNKTVLTPTGLLMEGVDLPESKRRMSSPSQIRNLR